MKILLGHEVDEKTPYTLTEGFHGSQRPGPEGERAGGERREPCVAEVEGESQR